MDSLAPRQNCAHQISGQLGPKAFLYGTQFAYNQRARSLQIDIFHDHHTVREEVMVQTVTRRRQYQSCQRNDPLLLDQPVVLYSIILAMMIIMMAIMIPLTTVRKFCFELPLRESNDRKTNQQNSPQHRFYL